MTYRVNGEIWKYKAESITTPGLFCYSMEPVEIAGYGFYCCITHEDVHSTYDGVVVALEPGEPGEILTEDGWKMQPQNE